MGQFEKARAARGLPPVPQEAPQPPVEPQSPADTPESVAKANLAPSPQGYTTGQQALGDVRNRQDEVKEPGEGPPEPVEVPPALAPQTGAAPAPGPFPEYGPPPLPLAEEAARKAMAQQEEQSKFTQWAQEKVAAGEMDDLALKAIKRAELMGVDPQKFYAEMQALSPTVAELNEMVEGPFVPSLLEMRKKKYPRDQRRWYGPRQPHYPSHRASDQAGYQPALAPPMNPYAHPAPPPPAFQPGTVGSGLSSLASSLGTWLDQWKAGTVSDEQLMEELRARGLEK